MSHEHREDKCRKAEIFELHSEACRNTNFRKEVLTGKKLQVTVMCIPRGGEVGLEVHECTDQLIRVENGSAKVFFGEKENCVKCAGTAECGDVIFVPAGTWHNVVNNGMCSLKLSSVYAPPHHPVGTVHRTKCDADRE